MLDRAADIEKTAFQAFARRHQAAGADDHFVFDHRAIHDGAAHANQNSVAQGAAVEHDFVTNGYFITDQQRKSIRVERPCVGNVQHAAILHAATRTNADAVHIAADHGQRPH
ncbi:hypothetical protein D3C75_1156340 [compost metagenome]